MLLKILSLFSPHLSEFWVKKLIILLRFRSVIIVSSISNDNVDEAVNVETSCGLYTALACYSSITASTLKVLSYELYVYMWGGEDGGGEWGALHNLIEPRNIWVKTPKVVNGESLTLQQGDSEHLSYTGCLDRLQIRHFKLDGINNHSSTPTCYICHMANCIFMSG